MTAQHRFRRRLVDNYREFLQAERGRFPEQDTVRIDLHCHDYNSDVTDELWGRILRLPETWLTTENLFKCLKENGADAYAVTNHNNARSVWEARDKGYDVVSGSEFTCHFPEFDVKIHVLCYGFTPEQEVRLVKLRKNIYRFAEYCREHELPTVIPHPLYFYSPKFRPPPSLFEKFALLFERFEVLNGQRDLWQNTMTAAWLKRLTPEVLEDYGRKHGIKPGTYTFDPYRKRMTGGSDDHAGLFAGSCGTLLHIPNLAARRKREKMSDLVLEAIKYGDMAPYGILGEEEKLNVGLLDYFCQVALNMEDSGLVRMFLHHGTLKDKLACLGIANAIHEMRRHKTTMRFLKVFHDALNGRRPSKITGFLVNRTFKPIFTTVDGLARSRKQGPEAFMGQVRECVPALYTELNHLLANRLNDKMKDKMSQFQGDPAEIVRRLEVPNHLRALFSAEATPKRRDMSKINLGDMFDKLSFPMLASALLAGSSMTSSKVLYANREFLNGFAEKLGDWQHPRRTLWLTDTLNDKNGVSTVLRATLEVVRKQNLPIDFLVCDDKGTSGDHLHVIRPVGQFAMPWYPEQTFRSPDLLQVQRLFREGAYDRVICSTELLMGPVALYLANAFKVPAYFYMHTDWLDFFEKNTSLEDQAIDRVRRILRAFYRRFNGVFVLNEQHRKWLTSRSMGLAPERVFKTAHWAGSAFRHKPRTRAELFDGISETDPVMLFAGRLSNEKGVGVIPDVVARVREKIPHIKMVFAGTGPAEAALRERLPDAHFAGWVDAERLAEIYSSVDLLLLPSQFDTFGCVVLEAMSCGCPVAAFNCKGPADIITHETDGFLVEDASEMADAAVTLLSEGARRNEMKRACFDKARKYQADDIMANLCRDLGLHDPMDINHERGLDDPNAQIPLPEDNQPGFFEDILEMANVE